MLLFTTSSCNIGGITGIKGSNNVVSEERDISSNFETIKVQQGINLYLTQGNSTDLKVEADDNIIDILITEVKNDELKIYFDKNVYKAKARNVYLTTSDISKIRTSSGAHVKSENTIQTNTLNLDSSSGSSINIYVNADEITSESSSGSSIQIFGKTNIFSANSSSGSSIKVTVNANEISSSSSSGANINVYGKAKLFSASASSGSSIDADKLETINTTAKVSSGANIDVNVSGKLVAKASSGGSIDYEGNPTEVNKDTSSGGSVSGS